MRLHGIRDFDELMQKSTGDVAWFTDAVLKFLDIQFYEPYSNVVDLSGRDSISKMVRGREDEHRPQLCG
jgi:acetyl-CoA synthetase